MSQLVLKFYKIAVESYKYLTKIVCMKLKINKLKLKNYLNINQNVATMDNSLDVIKPKEVSNF